MYERFYNLRERPFAPSPDADYLDAPDTAVYINNRLEEAAIGDPKRFPADAAELVHRLSGGVPRIINVICDATLVYGYAEARREIDRALVEEVARELESTGVVRQTHAPATIVLRPAASRRRKLPPAGDPLLQSAGSAAPPQRHVGPRKGPRPA